VQFTLSHQSVTTPLDALSAWNKKVLQIFPENVSGSLVRPVELVKLVLKR
jgi:hypothetical protein